MTAPEIKLVLVPWGSDSPGEDVWLLENALVFGIESIFEKAEVSFADLYDQLGGEEKRATSVRPYTDGELRTLASRAPSDTSGVVDGLITIIRDPESSSITTAEFAPRTLLLPDQSFDIPDAFRFESFETAASLSAPLEIVDQDHWHALVILIAEAILRPFGKDVPAHIGPETLRLTPSWEAYCAFLKGKRGARTVDEKLGYYRQAVRLDQNFYWAHFNAGQLFKQQQDYHSARREFLAAIDGAEDDPNLLGDVYFELGLTSIFLGDTKTARNFWDQALTFAPNNPVLLVNIAGTYEQEEDWQSATRLHEEALAIDPDYYKAIVSLGRLKAQMGNIEEAIPLYEKALSLRPEDPLRHAILGGCYLSLGDEEKARTYFDRASTLDPPGSRREIRIDEADAPPAPGDYARQELAKLDEVEAKRRKPDNTSGGWRWFGRRQ